MNPNQSVPLPATRLAWGDRNWRRLYRNQSRSDLRQVDAEFSIFHCAGVIMSICRQQVGKLRRLARPWFGRIPRHSMRLFLFAGPLALLGSVAHAQGIVSQETITANPAPDYSFTLTSTADAVQVGQAVDLVATLGDGLGPFNEATIYFYDAAGSGTPFGDPLCIFVPVRPLGSSGHAHCVTTLDTPGLHDVIAAIDPYAGAPQQAHLITNDIPINVSDPIPFDADQFALTGSWYDPSTPGQGIELSMYPDHITEGIVSVFGGWFTFDNEGNPQWYTLQGYGDMLHGDYVYTGIFRTTDGKFDAPPITRAIPNGGTTLTFHDCTHATLYFDFGDGRSGLMPLVRLTSPSGCSDTVPAIPPDPSPAHYNDTLHSGVWYEPETSGQGLTVDISPEQSTLFATWNTYAPASEGLTGDAARRWFALQTSYTPGDLSFEDVPIYTSSGGIFNQTSTVTREVVGSANLTFTSCSTMTLDYTFTEGEFAGLSGSIDEINPAPPAGCE